MLSLLTRSGIVAHVDSWERADSLRSEDVRVSLTRTFITEGLSEIDQRCNLTREMSRCTEYCVEVRGSFYN